MKIPFPTRHDLIIAMIIAGLVIIFGYLLNFSKYLDSGSEKDYFKPNLYRLNKGIITKKYIDKDNHEYKTIEFVMNDSLEYFYTLNYESDLFNYIQIHDSILKTKFGNEIIIKRNNTDSVFKLILKGYD